MNNQKLKFNDTIYTIKIMKYLLGKPDQKMYRTYPYTENYKAMLREIQVLNKWRDV